jgi:hypothetical protein
MGKSAATRDSILDRANSFALNSFADPHPLNPYGSILCKNGGREGGSLLPGISFSSNLPNLPNDSSSQKVAASENRLCYTGAVPTCSSESIGDAFAMLASDPWTIIWRDELERH